MNKIISNQYIRYALFVFIGLIFGWVFFHHSPIVEGSQDHSAEENKVQIWTCAMHPQIRKTEPGKCPICGMDLVPLNQGSASKEDPSAIHFTREAAQLANVLQAVILTKDDKMVLTPTWYVFRMFRVHQNARLLPIDVVSEDYVYGGQKIPAVSASASINDKGQIHISMANLNPGKDVELTCKLVNFTSGQITGEILTASQINSFNSFENSSVVKTAPFSAFKVKDGVLSVILPSKSVIMFEINSK